MEAECINHKGYIGNSGYGLTYDPVNKKTISAHRLAFREANGFLPEVVMHLCNNKTCVNPGHLKAGTQSENVLASYRDGLQINPHRKLTREDVLNIYFSPLSGRKLAELYSVTQRVPWMIKNGKSYCEITGHGGSCGV